MSEIPVANGIAVNDYVRRTKGYPVDVGRRGIVTEVRYTLGGDHLATVKGDDGTLWRAYTRQLAVIV